MVQAITFEQVLIAGFSSAATFKIETGTLAAIITPRQEVSDLLIQLLLGISKTSSGTVTILGIEQVEILAPSLLQQQIGVVAPSGGLIFNLKVWENILLPMEYHLKISRQEIEERANAALLAVGFCGAMHDLPGHLSLFEHRLVGQARTFAMQPALLVYNELLGGLKEKDQGRIADNAIVYHRSRPGTTSLFLTSQPDTIRSLPLDQCIVLEGGVNR